MPQWLKGKAKQVQIRKEINTSEDEAEVANVNKQDGSITQNSKNSKAIKRCKEVDKDVAPKQKRSKPEPQSKRGGNEALSSSQNGNSQNRSRSDDQDDEVEIAMVTDEENGVQITVTKGNESYCQSDYEGEEGELPHSQEDGYDTELNASQ